MTILKANTTAAKPQWTGKTEKRTGVWCTLTEAL